MIMIVVALALLTLVGMPLARAIDPSLSIGARVGIGFLLGCGVVTLVMMASSAAGLQWSLIAVLVAMALVAGFAFRFALERRGAERPELARNGVATALDIGTAISLGGYALFTSIARPWEWDFWAIWGLKARVYFVGRGIDSGFLTNPDNYYSHPDYPPLLSTIYDFVALLRGGWDDRWFGLLFVAFAGALLLVIRDEVRRATESETFSALATLALSGTACSPWVGLGEGPLVAFGTAGLLILSRGVRDEDSNAIVLSGTLLGFAAMTKNEGVALIVAASIGVLVLKRQRLASFVAPAVVFAAPWLFWRSTLELQTDVISGGLLARLSSRLSDPLEFLTVLRTGTPDRIGFWVILLVLLAVGGRAIVRRQGVMLTAVLLQVLFYVWVYAGTVHDLASHVQSSMGRISGHVATAAGVICAIAIWDVFLRESVLVERLGPVREEDTGGVEEETDVNE